MTLDPVRLRALVRELADALAVMTDAAAPHRQASDEFRAECQALVARARLAIIVRREYRSPNLRFLGTVSDLTRAQAAPSMLPPGHPAKMTGL